MASLFINEEEKQIILEILEDLKRTNELENCDIGIITGYSGQKDILRKSVKAKGYDKVAQIDINTLDAFQGRENDIIIYSTVRTKDSIGFQKEKERVNVAFSRAKKLLIICGDIDCFYNYDDPNNKFIEIIFDASNYQLLDKVIADDNKLKPIIPIGEVKCFIEKFKEISEIFDEENFLVQIGDLLLYGLKHTGFATFIRNTKNGAELFVEVSNAYGGQAQVFHVIEARIQSGGKASQGIGFSHAGTGGKHTDSRDVLQIIQPVGQAKWKLFFFKKNKSRRHVVRKITDVYFGRYKLHGNIQTYVVDGNGRIFSDFTGNPVVKTVVEPLFFIELIMGKYKLI